MDKTNADTSPRLLFGGTIFLASLLLFLGEPMAAKELLPVFGGSAAVWITCLVFFQIALLAGYLYAHNISRRAGVWVWLHLALLVAAVGAAVAWAGGVALVPVSAEHPAASIFARLGVSIGLPFLMLGATSPLLQVWLGRVSGGGVPYWLYGVSNLASLAALVAYPALVEPHLSLRIQRVVWACGVVMFAGVSGVLAWRIRGVAAKFAAGLEKASGGFSSAAEAARLKACPSEVYPSGVHLSAADDVSDVGAAIAHTAFLRRVLWFLLAMAGAMQLSAVTAHLTVNVAAIPLLWILPLAAYLATFVVAFRAKPLLSRNVTMGLLAVLLVSLGNFLTKPEMALPIGLAIGMFVAEVFFACLFFHAELYALRPMREDETTFFYLMLAAGGAAGSFAIGIVAPLVFRGNYDLSLTFVLTAVLALAVCWKDDARLRLLWVAGVALMVGLAFVLRAAQVQDTLMTVRNFYGSLRVKHSVLVIKGGGAGDDMRTLMHGTIVHGTEIFSPALMRVPTTYYAPDSGIGLALAACCAGHARHIGVVGLGAGTIAAYGRAGDRIRFYEINPAVRPIAENLFAYIKGSGATVTFAEGDARASLAAEPAQGFDVLAIDAFSGDAIPLHLLTVQALAVYRQHLAPGGVLAFHVSNQYVDLAPELRALAAASGMTARNVASEKHEETGELAADWVLMSNDASLFAREGMAGRALPIDARVGVKVWTDDYSSLLPLVRW